MPSTPCSTAKAASSAVIMPLITTFMEVSPRSHLMSSHKKGVDSGISHRAAAALPGSTPRPAASPVKLAISKPGGRR